jgi:hypothetical protein
MRAQGGWIIAAKVPHPAEDERFLLLLPFYVGIPDKEEAVSAVREWVSPLLDNVILEPRAPLKDMQVKALWLQEDEVRQVEAW